MQINKRNVGQVGVIYEGTSEVKVTKANLLITEYEIFRMKTNKSIFDMFA